MSEIRLYKKPKRAIIQILISVSFVIIGIFLQGRENFNATDIIMSWLVIGFFGLGITVGFYHLFDKKPQIVINEKWIYDRTTKQGKIPWQFIEEAYPTKIYGQKFISLKLNKDFELKLKQYRWVTSFNRSVGAQKVNLQISQLAVNPLQLTEFILNMRILDEDGRKREIKNVAQHVPPIF